MITKTYSPKPDPASPAVKLNKGSVDTGKAALAQLRIDNPFSTAAMPGAASFSPGTTGRAASDNYMEDLLLFRISDLEARLAELDAFACMASHDLKAPLRVIDSLSQILEEEYKDNISPDGIKCLQAIRVNVRRMQHLTEALLAMARMRDHQLQIASADIKTMVMEIIEDLQRHDPARRVVWKIEDLQDTRCDPILMRQVFFNLLSNAWKYTSKRPESWIEIRSWLNGPDIVYAVADNGVGFDMSQYSYLFRLLSRLHSADDFEGNGLGLGIVKHIVERHQGRVWAESEIDNGAIFYVSLPRVS